LIDKSYRPTVILTESNGLATGSARSVDGFDLYSAIEECSDLLEQYGGHTHAAGLTMRLENVVKFTEKFERIVANNINERSLVPEIEYDVEIPLRIITQFHYTELRKSIAQVYAFYAIPLCSFTHHYAIQLRRISQTH
jgi:single-stranded-DNA-specific exonuclease